MQMINQYREAKQRLSAVKWFLSLIGKPQRTTANSNGYLSSITVDVTIHHQETDGAKNYHTDSHFNAALATVIKRNFHRLQTEALNEMQSKLNDLAVSASVELDVLQREFAEIAALASPLPPAPEVGK
jgi:hypothetical protein